MTVNAVSEGIIVNDIRRDPFEEYVKNLAPDEKELGQAWSAAIGLQDVDGLKPSEYLYETAMRNIAGEISVAEANALIDSYYESKESRADTAGRTEEADKVAARIAKILSENAFTFSPAQYIAIHRELFRGIYSHAGMIRDYNITKKEWVLDGDSVSYGSASELSATLIFDISQEREFRYNGLTPDETIRHLAVFVSRLWQIHVFGEGNTRTTAVFFIKYLRMLGFDADNALFAENSWYFRNALVRANYNNVRKGVYRTTEFLEMFLKNLLFNAEYELHNREMHISGEFLSVHDDPINEPVNEPINAATSTNIRRVKDAREAAIIRLIKEDSGLTRYDMAKRLGCSESTVKRALRSLIDKGAVRHIGSNKKGEWVIAEEV